MVSMEGFGVTPDGRHLSGQFPVAGGRSPTWRTRPEETGRGLLRRPPYARGPLFWYFDGANVTMVDVDTGRNGW